MKKTLLLLSLVLFSASGFAMGAGMGSDDPLLLYVKADKLEWRDDDEGNLLVWELDAWLGKDLDKLWIKSSGESLDGTIESHALDLLYSRAISAFWDLQFGIRHEFKPEPEQDWVGIGLMGVAPYLFEIDLNLFINDDSQANLRLDAEVEYMFTQKLVLVPNLELSLYSDEDIARGIRSGLSSAELGLRLYYQIRREFSPYIGINLEKQFGNAVIVSSRETQLVAGLSFWF